MPKPCLAALAMLNALREGQSPIVAVLAAVANGPPSAITEPRQPCVTASAVRVALPEQLRSSIHVYVVSAGRHCAVVGAA